MSEHDDRWAASQAYEAFMGRWSRDMARQFLDWLPPGKGGHWLDLGCGTGALSAAVAALRQPASVLGCDPSAAFVAGAREANPDLRCRFQVADAGQLPAREGGYDAIVSGLVLNFVPQVAQAVSGMRERLVPGGLLAAYVWDYAEGMQFLRLFWDAAVALNPAAAEFDEGRRFPLCQPQALATLFEGAGLAQVTTTELLIDTRFADFDDYWQPFLARTGPAPAYVDSLDPAQREALRRRLQAQLPVAADGSISLRARSWAVCGYRR